MPVSTETEVEEMVKQVEEDLEKDSEHSGDDGITYNYYEEDYFEFTTTMMPGTVQNNQFDLIEYPSQYPAETTGDSFGDISRFDSPVKQIPSPTVQKENKNFEYDYHVPVEDFYLKLGYPHSFGTSKILIKTVLIPIISHQQNFQRKMRNKHRSHVHDQRQL